MAVSTLACARFAAFVALVLMPAVAFADSLPDSLASSWTRYVLFTNTHAMADGSAIWLSPTTYLEGRVHTNSQFRFAGSPTFTDTVSSVSGMAWFYNNGSPLLLASDHNGTIDVPSFTAGLVRGAPPAPLPSWDYTLLCMAAGAPPGQYPSAPSLEQLRNWLGLGPGATPPPAGICLPTSGASVIGGLYVQGSIDRLLVTPDPGGTKQVWQLTQAGAISTITVDRVLGTTMLQRPAGTPTVYLGLPRGAIYCTGSIADLRGPDRVAGAPPPALLDGYSVTILAVGDIVLQRDMTVANYSAGSAVMGIVSMGGSVRVGTSAPNDAHLDAFVMATGARGVFAVDDYGSGSRRGTFHLRGGCVSSYFGSFSTFNGSVLQTGYARDFRHDDRGWIPPYFPRIPAGTTVATPPALPIARLALSRPWPNPSRGELHVRYALPRPGPVRLSLFDVTGRRVALLVNGPQRAGEHEASWGRGASSALRPGLYLMLLESGGERARAKVTVLR